MKKLLASIAVLAATLAVAATQLDLDVSRYLHAFTTGLVISPKSLLSDTQIASNRITRSLSGSATIDFAAGTIVCEDSAAITVTGARANDVCLVGLTTTAGAANSSFTCYVSASDAVKVRHCPAGTASNPASQAYYVRIFSNQ